MLALTAISPVDGRYSAQTEELNQYFSEYALIRYRVRVEMEYLYFISGLEIPGLKRLRNIPPEQYEKIWKQFSLEDAQWVKDSEKITNHDVKAVEYFLKDRLSRDPEFNLSPAESEYIHFGLTSQDINNTAIPLMLKEAVHSVYIPWLHRVLEKLQLLALDWKSIPMLAHTHGQPASPTSVGKEIAVFRSRLQIELDRLLKLDYPAKFGGATGNLNAHKAAFPHIHWPAEADTFVEKQLGLTRSKITTQIEHYDGLAAIFDTFSRINTILTDMSRDFWTYISMEYFTQKTKAGEVGSSAMPHKVNPIDFENAEGNLGIANVLFHHFSAKLPVSRLQRDLTDSTVLRNVGVPVAHTLLAFKSVLKGLEKLQLNQIKLDADLNAHWTVLAEPIQTILRREGFPKPYEALRDLTRGNQMVTRESLHTFIDTLDIREEIKSELRQLTPFNYLGYAAELVSED